MSAVIAKRRFTDHKEFQRFVVASAETQAEARTMFPSRRIGALEPDRLLKSGVHSRKIGSHVTKGRWKGMPVYTLTLEERATCPATCEHWGDCYGNKMNWSRRIAHGPELENRLRTEVAALALEHPKGFVVRLHVLGDFYSVEYVDLWLELLHAHPALRVYGYTAWPTNTAIGTRVAKIAALRWGRFAVRTSNGPGDMRVTRTVEREATGIVTCPAQTGRTDCCGTCALCWHTQRPIAFLRH